VDLVPKKHTAVFRIIMWVRIVYGAMRVVLGLALLKFLDQTFSDLIFWLMAHEFAGRHDFLVQILSPVANHVHFHVTLFIACYLLFWGSMDIFLSAQMLIHRLWAYKVAFVCISLFVFYECLRLIFMPSLTLLSFIIYDIIVLYLIYREYCWIEKRYLLSEPKCE
jgi:uncharacterized membrane protein